jgi:hypothetical protein
MRRDPDAVIEGLARTGPKRSRARSHLANALVLRTGIARRELVKHFEEQYETSSVYREIRKMVADGRLVEVAGVIALPCGQRVANSGQ